MKYRFRSVISVWVGSRSGNALILVLDPALIYGLGFGVRGAAIATVSGRAVALAAALALVRRRGLGGESAIGELAIGESGVGEQPVPEPAIGKPAVGEPTVGEPTVNEQPETRASPFSEALEVARAGAPLGADFVVRMAGATALAAVVAGFGVAAVAAYGKTGCCWSPWAAPRPWWSWPGRWPGRSGSAACGPRCGQRGAAVRRAAVPAGPGQRTYT
ncbi:MAG: hypothetical protein HOV87_18495, partial [Catenulispora sp.]|nr:hypothetical protein [Catenulispora sp.]